MTIRIRTRRYDLDHPMPQAGGYRAPFYPEVKGMYEQMEPAREGNVHSDVLVPLLQSIITGVFGGAFLTLVTWYLIAQNAEYALYAFGVSFVVIAAVVWMGLLNDHKRLLWRVERLVGKDFDRDGTVGEPDRVVVEVRKPGEYGDNIEFLHYKVSREALEEFAGAALRGESLAVNKWTGQGAPFSRGEYEALRSAMISDGLLRVEKGKTVVTPRGREIFTQMLPRV